MRVRALAPVVLALDESGFQVASLDRLCQLDLLLGGEQRVAACLVVEDLETVGGRLGCEVSIRAALDTGGGRVLEMLTAVSAYVIALTCSAAVPRHLPPGFGHDSPCGRNYPSILHKV